MRQAQINHDNFFQIFRPKKQVLYPFEISNHLQLLFIIIIQDFQLRKLQNNWRNDCVRTKNPLEIYIMICGQVRLDLLNQNQDFIVFAILMSNIFSSYVFPVSQDTDLRTESPAQL